MASIVGGEGITNPFEAASDRLKDLKVETKDYENNLVSLGDTFSGLGEKMKGFLGGSILSAPTTTGGGEGTGGGGDNLVLPTEGLIEITDEIEEQEDAVDSLKESYSELQEVMFDAAKSMGLQLAKGAEGFKEFGEAAKSSAREFLDIMWSKISLLAIEKAVASVPPTPFNLVFIPAAIGAALGLVKTAMNQIPAFAEGGIVTGPTMGLVGEAGPEVIFPLSKLRSFMGEGMGGKVQVQGILTGQDIFLSNARTDISLNRIG